MNAFQVVTEKVAEVTKLTAGFLAQAAAGLVDKAETLSLEEMSRRLDGALRALRGEDLSASGAATTSLPASKTATTLTIEHMKQVLRVADCLYDDSKIWKQLGANEVPELPDAVIREAYEKGGRVILRCSSISEKADALKGANHYVGFSGDAKQEHYQQSVSKPEWIVVPSHIDRSTLGGLKSKVVTSEMPAPTPEDWFSVIAYARFGGGRQPKGSEGHYAFTTETGTVVGSRDDRIDVSRHDNYVRCGFLNIGAAGFGPPRN